MNQVLWQIFWCLRNTRLLHRANPRQMLHEKVWRASAQLALFLASALKMSKTTTSLVLETVSDVESALWQVLLRARAIETQSFVLAAAQVGAHHSKRTSFGHALAVDPWGEVIGDCGGSDAGLTLVQIDLQRLRDVRRDMPVQRHRRDHRFYCSLDWAQNQQCTLRDSSPNNRPHVVTHMWKWSFMQCVTHS